MPLNLDKLGAEVAKQVQTFLPADRTGAVGAELPRDWESGELTQMSKALVQPYPAKLRDVSPEGVLVVVDAVVVVDDRNGNLVLFDPSADQFVLAVREADANRARAVDIVSCGVRGNVVDCFLSR